MFRILFRNDSLAFETGQLPAATCEAVLLVCRRTTCCYVGLRLSLSLRERMVSIAWSRRLASLSEIFARQNNSELIEPRPVCMYSSRFIQRSRWSLQRVFASEFLRIASRSKRYGLYNFRRRHSRPESRLERKRVSSPFPGL